MHRFVRGIFSAAVGVVLLSCGDSHPTGPGGSEDGPAISPDAITSEGAGGPTVATDKLDYSPGDTVTVIGSGWQANETVSLVLTEDPAAHEATLWNVVADSAGAFTDRSFAIEVSHIGVAFQLVATGAASADTAQGTFTDGNFRVQTNSGTMKINWDWYGNATCSGGSSGGANNVSIGTSVQTLIGIVATQSAKVNITNAPAGMSFVSMTTGGDTRTTTTECFVGSAGTQTWTANFAFLSTTAVTANVASPRTAGDSITFSATVTKNVDNSALSAGTVTFYDGGSCATPGAELQAATNLPGSGIVTFKTATLSAGAHTILACYSGSTAGDPDVLESNGSLAYTINPGSVGTTTAVTPSPASPSEFGTSVTFTATVTQTTGGAAVTTGNVSFHATSCAGTELQAAAAVDGSGQKTYVTSTLAVGAHTVVACYEGATGFDPSNGSAAYTINKDATTTGVTANKTSPQPAGTSVTFTAAVTRTTGGSAVPVGNVRFIEGGSCASPTTLLQAATAVNGSGQVPYTTSALGVGTHTIAACYDGDTNYDISTGSMSFTIDSAATVTTVTPNPASPSEFGTSVTFTAAVTSGGSAITTGSIRFVDGTCASPTSTLQAGAAVNGSGEVTYTTSSLAVGSNTIRACYDGTATYATSTGTAAYTINKIATGTAVTTNLTSPQNVGAGVTFTATVTRTTGGAAVTTGNVRFIEGGTCTGPTTTLQSATAVNGSGQVSFSGSSLSAGEHAVVACYDGTSSYEKSEGSKSFTFNLAATATNVTASPSSPREYGTSVTFTAAVTSGGSAVTAGNVRFIEGGSCASPATTLQSATAVNGSGEVAYTSSTLGVASHTIVACYDGTSSYDISNGSIPYTINKIGTTLTLTPDLASSQEFGTSIVFTAEVNRTTGGADVTAGNVAFYEGGSCTTPGAELQAAAGVDGNGKKTFTTNTLAVGNHTIVACYAGNDTLATSGDSEPYTITKILTTTTLGASTTSPKEYGTSVTFTAEVNRTTGGADVAAGNVTFYEGGDCTSLGTVLQASSAVSGTGTATYTPDPFTVGAHNIVACYEGNTNFEASHDNEAFTINKIATTTAVSVLPASPQVWGTSLVFTAEVNRTTGGADVNQGSVAFYDGGNCTSPGTQLQAAGAVDSDGKKTLTTTTLEVGAHNVLACYLGNDTLAISNDSEAFTVNKIPTTVTLSLTPATSQQYSDSVTLSAAVTPNTTAGSVQFSKQVNGGSFVAIGSPVAVASGEASTKYAILESSADALAFKAVFTPTDTDHFAGDDDSKGLTTVTKEDAKVEFNSGNPAALQVSTPGGALDANALTLTVTLREKTPDVGTAGTAAGDISNGGLSVTLNPLGGGSGITLNCTSLSNNDAGYAEVVTYTCKNIAALPVNAYQVDASVPGTNLYYAGSDTDAFTVFDPSLGFATGGGTYTLGGDKLNFGFTMKYTKNGTNLQGNLIAVRHHPDGTVSRIKSNSLGALAITDVAGCGIAQFNGKATYMTWSSSINDYVNTGNNNFVVYAKDCNNPGTGVDWIWLDGPGNLDMPGNGENAVQLNGGNIAVPHKPAR